MMEPIADVPWQAGGVCPVRNNCPGTCATFVAIREWVDVTQTRYCGVFEIGPVTWAAIRRAAVRGGHDFDGGPPLIAAPYALIARWIVAGGNTWLHPLARSEPGDVYRSLRRVLGVNAPNPRAFALALGRDASAARAWIRHEDPGGSDGIVCLAATLLHRGSDALLAGRWASWWAMAQREARLRGIPSLIDAGSWRVTDRVVVPAGHWRVRQRRAGGHPNTPTTAM